MRDSIPSILLTSLESKTKILKTLKPRIIELNDKIYSDCLDYLSSSEDFTWKEESLSTHRAIMLYEPGLYYDYRNCRYHKLGVRIAKYSFHSLITPGGAPDLPGRGQECVTVYNKMRKLFPRDILDNLKTLKSLIAQYKAQDRAIIKFCHGVKEQFGVDIKPAYDMFKAKNA